MVAVLDDEHRYVRVDQHERRRVEQLFDRRDDPAELATARTSKPEGLARLQQIAEHYLGAAAALGRRRRRARSTSSS